MQTTLSLSQFNFIYIYHKIFYAKNTKVNITFIVNLSIKSIIMNGYDAIVGWLKFKECGYNN